MSLSLDGTGVAVANKITAEVHPINTVAGKTMLVLNQRLFYSRGFKIVFTDADGDTRALSQGADYSFLYSIRGVVPNNPIYAGVVFDAIGLSGTISVTYQALGGNWSLHAADINQRAKDLEVNTQIAYIALRTLEEFKNSNGDPIELDSFAALQAVQTAAAGNPVTLTIQVKPNTFGQSVSPIGSSQFESLQGFNAAECMTFVISMDGKFLPLDSLPHAYTYDGSGNRLTDTVTFNGVDYQKTYTYTGGRLMSETGWEAL